MTALARSSPPNSVDLLLDLDVGSPLPRCSRPRRCARWRGSIPTRSCRRWPASTPIATGRCGRRRPLRSGRCLPRRGAARLTLLLEDRDPARRSRVASCAAWRRRRRASDAMLLERLKADDFAVRAAAANGLARTEGCGGRARARRGYRAAAGDSTYVGARRRAHGARTARSRCGRPLLQEALSDRDWAVRVRAATLLAGAGQRTAPSSTRRCARRRRAGRSTTEEWQALVNPTVLAARLHRDRPRDDRDRAGDPRRAADRRATSSRWRARGSSTASRSIASCPTSSCRTAIRAATAKAGPATRSATRSTAALSARHGRHGARLGGHRRQPVLHHALTAAAPRARYTVFGHVVNGMEVVDRFVPWDIMRQRADLGRGQLGISELTIEPSICAVT